MKNISVSGKIFPILVVIFLFTSTFLNAQQSIGENLCKLWNVTGMAVGTDTITPAMAEINVFTAEFTSDKRFALQENDQVEEGEWTYQEITNTLVFNYDDASMPEEKGLIVKLSKDLFILELILEDGDEQAVQLIMEPAK
ncbi:MAG: hypothetical protein K8R53_05675 [Bacteroidales bacterium]|nr:hypothetical protein [Bacteroidales bacterium]